MEEVISKEIQLKLKDIDGRFVYILKCNDFYKIGVASNLTSRLSNIQSANPYTVKLIFAQKTKTAFGVEQFLHEKLHKHHHRGEWFSFDEEKMEKIVNNLNEVWSNIE